MTWYDKNNKEKELKVKYEEKRLEFYKYYYDNYFNEELILKDKDYDLMLKELEALRDELMLLGISSDLNISVVEDNEEE